MDRLVRHLSFLESTLKAITPSSNADLDSADQPDDASIRRSGTSVLESIHKYALVGVWLCQGQMKNAPRSTVPKSPGRSASATRALSFEETLWLDLILAVVAIARDVSITSFPKSADGNQDQFKTTMSLRTTIQAVFTALLTSTTTYTRDRSGSGSHPDMTFLRILRAFLTHAAQASPSLTELRSVIGSIFSAYAYEEALLALSNSMLDKDVFVQLDEVGKLRQRGWRPRGQVCEVCRRRVWGPGLGTRVWEEWTRKEEARRDRRWRRSESSADEDDGARGKGKATSRARVGHDENTRSGAIMGGESVGPGPIVVFSCRHLYHQKCLSQEQGPMRGHLENGGPGLVCPSCV